MKINSKAIDRIGSAWRTTAISCLCLLVSLAAHAVTSTFTADKTSGCAPLVVNFTPVDPPCSGCTYTWNFGTGSPVPGYTASSSFLTVGVHVVTLTVTSGATTSSSTRTITVYNSPTVNFTADDTAFCPGGGVVLTNASSNGTPGAATYKWTFGDGDTAVTANTSHTYPLPGYYNVALTVTNSQGCARTHVKTTFIHVYNLPVISFTPSRTTLCDPPGIVSFSNGTTGAAPITYTWRFGDNTTSTLPNPNHTYSTTGSFYVTLKATDRNGCVDSLTSANYIYVGDVNASFNAPDTACRYSSVTFTNTSTTHTFRQWIFGDGATSDSLNAHHVYTATGTYTVKLVAGFSPCVDTETRIIRIISGPPGAFTASPEHPCPSPVRVKYTSTAPPGTNVNWLFEKAHAKAGDTVSNDYLVDSIVYIRMIKIDPLYGCRDTLEVKDTLYNLAHMIQADRAKGCAPHMVKFSWLAVSSQPDPQHANPYPYGIDTIIWKFDDGSGEYVGDTISHLFVDTGDYKVTAYIRTGNGCVYRDSMYVQAGIAPAATFTASPLHVCKVDSVSFFANVTLGQVDSFIWDFSDFLKTDDTPYVKRAFNLPGLFTVTLTPCYKGCCGDSFVREDYVLVDSPKVEFYSQFYCPIDLTIKLTDTSMGNDLPIWTFGDGDSAFVHNPMHTYSVEGSYPVQLIAKNAASGCTDSSKFYIKVVDPHPDFTADKTNFCDAQLVTFTPSDTSIAVLAYSWMADGLVTPFNQFADSPNHKQLFVLPGRYTVHLVSWDDNGCYDTITKVNYITQGAPVPGFAPSPQKACVPATITFTDTTRNVPGLTSTQFRWRFGDGDTALTTSPVITHTYTLAGTYTVTETITNSAGCKDSTRRVVVINKATPAFVPSNTHPCLGVLVNFSNSTPGVVTSSWTFGDMGASTATSPTHSYSDTGAYTITLTVTDTNGCTATGVYPGLIVVTKPEASFTVNDTESICVPFLAEFHNTGTGGSTYNWTFGDLHSSVVPSPTNNYTVSGIYNVRQEVTSIYGCKDTAYGRVRVYGYPGSFTYTPTTGCKPLTVHFNSLLSTVPTIYWDFADGVIDSTALNDTISHTYTVPGAYVPKLILSDNAGCITSSMGLDTIKVGGVIARIDINPDTICPGTIFTLADSSRTYWSPITVRTWTYDGTTNYAPFPTHAITIPGVYPVHLEVVNGWGCTASKDTTLTVIGVAPITGTAEVCAGASTTLSSTTTGGTWSSGMALIATVGSSGVVTGIATGTAVITYSWSGCYVTRIVTVHTTPLPITGTGTVCAGATTTLSDPTTGGSWGTSATNITVSSSGVVTGISAGTAVVSYTASGCAATYTVTVAVTPAAIGGNTIFCSGSPNTFTNSVTGGVWSSSDTAVVTIAASGVATGIAPGVATISYTIGSCYATIAVTVDNSIPPITGTARVCVGASASLANTAPGGTWSSADVTIASVGSSGAVTGITAGTVYVSYILGGGCWDTALVTVLPLPATGTIDGIHEVCVGSTTLLTDTVSSGTWASAGAHTSISTTGLVTGLSAGKDTVAYTVSNADCRAKAIIEFTVNPLPNAGVIDTAGPYCIGAMATLNVTPATAGTWSSGSPAIATVDSSTASFSALSLGTTMVTFTTALDTHGCRNSTTRTVSVVPSTFSVAHTVAPVRCFGGSDGSIRLSIIGTPPFVYLWSNGDVADSIVHLPAGVYSVTVTQPSSNCVVSDSIDVSQADSIAITGELVADTCQLRKGSVVVTVAGGTTPYTYSWAGIANPPGVPVLALLLKGVYTLTVTDGNGCIDTASFHVPEAPCNDIVVYDVITPNGDGYNDRWVINGLSGYPGNIVQIFDKWGDLVYEAHGYKEEWYGQNKNGGLLPDGTYFYVVKLNEPSKTGGETEFAGTVMIKR